MAAQKKKAAAKRKATAKKKAAPNDGRRYRTTKRKENDLRLTAELYLKGNSVRIIAETLNEMPREHPTTHVTVFNDLKLLIAQWREARIENIDQLKQAELEKLNEVERAAWQGWERSLANKTRHSKEEGGSDKGAFEKEVTTEENQFGDPRFLSQAHKCIESRCRILGLEEPIQVEEVLKLHVPEGWEQWFEIKGKEGKKQQGAAQ